MKEEDLKHLREVLKIFDKAKFEVTGPDLVKIATDLTIFAKLIMRLENESKSKVVESKNTITGD